MLGRATGRASTGTLAVKGSPRKFLCWIPQKCALNCATLNVACPKCHRTPKSPMWPGSLNERVVGSSSGPGSRAARKVSNLWLWGLQGLSSTLLLHSNLPPFRCAVGTAVLPVLNLPVLTQGVGEGLHESLTDLIRVLGELRHLWNWIYINKANCGSW